MTFLRVYTVLDARLPHPITLDRQTRLWIVAARKSEAARLITERGITWRPETFAGPVVAGPFVTAMQRCGLLDQPAVYAYPMPWHAGTPVLRVESPRKVERVAVMGDVLGDMAVR